jgi:hypothetical protein
MDSKILKIGRVRRSLGEIGRIGRIGTIVKICTLVIGMQAILLYAEFETEADIKTQDTSQDSDMVTQDAKSQEKSKSTVKPKVDNNQIKADAQAKKDAKSKADAAKAKLIPFKTTLFVNGRVNNILLVITDDKNKQFKIHIKAGTHYSCGHKAQSLKKAVCYEINTTNTTLSQADLNAYSVFVFNTDQKLEKYNFISIKEKNIALKHARMTKNEKLFHEISDQPIYNP